MQWCAELLLSVKKAELANEPANPACEFAIRMSSHRFKKGAQKRDGGAFFAIPHAVLRSAAFCSLSAHACKLLLDIGEQYNGDNNGDLQACWKLMKRRGWRSQDTLQKAKVGLLAAKLMVETRKGARPNKATLYALTFYALDEMPGKLDMTSRSFPRGVWKDFSLSERDQEAMKSVRYCVSIDTPDVSERSG